MRKYWNRTIENVQYFVVSNWLSGRIFDKGKIIAIGVVLFFILWKLIYSIFA
tara:strand:- start:2194 stop:2349 length:156 start_codon:yes stop_codon:yes gene_type:complete